jgi:hypothetical protein
VLPEVFLLALSNTAALFVADLDDEAQDFVKLLNVLVAPVHVLEHYVEQSVDNVSSQVDENLSVTLNCLVVGLITFVQHCAGLKCAFFLANSQTFVDREVSALDEVHDLRLVLLVAQYLHE